MRFSLSQIVFGAALVVSSVFGDETPRASPVMLYWGSPYIHLNGRWDNTHTTWWVNSGFKIAASGLTELTVHLGNLTTTPLTSFGVSVNYGAWNMVNLTAGANTIPLGMTDTSRRGQTVVRFASEGWQNNNMQLEAVMLNAGATPHLYRPQNLKFQFIGDSLSAGQYCPDGVVNAWTFLTGENFKAEHNVQAQPGGCLTDIECWGNIHGLSYEFFKAEDTGYYNDPYHNYTTPWNFYIEQPPTHVVIHIGANDASTTYNISEPSFEATYMNFTTKLRELYPYQPFFIFTPWGWPAADGSIGYYYTDPSPYAQLVAYRASLGDTNFHLVNTTGWVNYTDVYPTNQHPNPSGHMKIAAQFATYLNNFGLYPEEYYNTPAY